MIELIVGIGLGYFLGRFTSMFAQPKLDMLLAWDPDVFAWRPCSQPVKMDKNKKYLAAIRVYPLEEETKEVMT